MPKTAPPGTKTKKKGVRKEEVKATVKGESGWTIKVVDTEMEGNRLRVTIESGAVSPLIDGPARRLAYEQRLEWGMAAAGIEASGGTYVPDRETAVAKKEGRDVALWRADFLITPRI